MVLVIAEALTEVWWDAHMMHVYVYIHVYEHTHFRVPVSIYMFNMYVSICLHRTCEDWRVDSARG